MPSRFAASAARVGASVDRVHGEQFQFLPYTADDPNGRDGPDASRPVTTITAIFGAPTARAGSGPARRGYVEPETAAVASARPYIEFASAQLPYKPVSGDRVVRVDTGERYRVAEPRSSGNGRTVIDLNKVG